MKLMRYIAATAFASVCLVSNAFGQLDAIERLEEIQRELDRDLANLHQLESEYGRLDRRMLEPLDLFSRSLIENERFTQAHDILDQAIQIIRISEGLYSQSQFPFLIRHIENHVNRGVWVNAREEMQHLDWLIKRGDNAINEELVATILDLIDIHLRGVADDFVANQSDHFRKAENLTNFVGRVARFNYEAGDVRIPAIMYKKVVQMYLQAVAVEAWGSTGLSLRSYSNTGYAISRSDARISLYYSGLRSLTVIRDLYMQRENPDLEGAGFAYFYIGDWEVLFNNPDAAGRAYKQGHNLLTAAGRTEEEINLYTSQAQMLPLIEFHGSFESALAASQDANTIDGEGSNTNFTFKQWSSQFPRTVAPVDYDEREVGLDEREYAIFSFNLLGLEQARRWYRGRLKKNVSSPRNLELINREITRSIDWLELTESIRDLHYRPKLVNGEAQTVSATLYFQLADR